MNYTYHKEPYHLAYPNIEYMNEDKLCKRDREYMYSIYPNIAKKIMPYIEEECDRLEYDTSLIYDAYPDKLMLRLMCGRIYQVAYPMISKKGEYTSEADQRWIREIIEVLVYQELCLRRQNKRSQRKRWY